MRTITEVARELTATNAKVEALLAKNEAGPDDEANLVKLDAHAETLKAELDKLNGNAAVAGRLATRKAALAEPMVKPSSPVPMRAGQRASVVERHSDTIEKVVDWQMGTYCAGSGMSGGSIGTGAAYMPEPTVTEAVFIPAESSDILSRCTKIPMTSNSVEIPAWKIPDFSAGDSEGDLSASWGGEGTEHLDQAAKTRRVTLTAHQCSVYTRASLELAQDARNFFGMTTKIMLEATSRQWEKRVVGPLGTGVGGPLSIGIHDSRVVVDKEDDQSADTFTWGNVSAMWSSMYGACRKNAIWIFHDSLIPSLLSMAVVAGLGGSAAWSPANGEAPFLTLLGRPVVFSQFASKLGDEGDAILVDLSQYAFGIRLEGMFETSNAPSWHTGEYSFRLITRVDGRPLWDRAIVDAQGESRSWCVTLAAR